MANTEGGLFGYFGLYVDLSVGPIYFTPQLGLGAYHRGDSRDLGGNFQFRETVELSYRFANGHRAGLGSRTSPTPTSTRSIRARRSTT